MIHMEHFQYKPRNRRAYTGNNNYNKYSNHQDSVRDFVETRVQVDGKATFRVQYNNDMNDGSSEYLGSFPRMIANVVRDLKLSKLILRSNASMMKQEHMPVGTELYAVSNSSSSKLDEYLLKRRMAGFSCTPLDSLKNYYGNADGSEYHGLSLTMSGMCIEELQSYLNLLPSADGAFYETLSTLTSTTSGVLGRTTNRAVGMEISTSDDCFRSVQYDDESKTCMLELNLFASYVVALTVDDLNADNIQVSLGDVFLGRRRARDYDDGNVLSVAPYRTSNDAIFTANNSFAHSSVLHTIIPLPNMELGVCREEDGVCSDYSQNIDRVLVSTTPTAANYLSSLIKFDHNLQSYETNIAASGTWITLPLELLTDFDKNIDDSNFWALDRFKHLSPGLVSRGSFTTKIRNSDMSCSVNVIEKEIYPFFITPNFSSLKVALHQGGGAGQSNYKARHTGDQNIVQIQLVQPSQDNGIEINFKDDGSLRLSINSKLPPDSSLILSIDFEPRFMNFESFPADPNRGVDIPPAFAIFTPDIGCDKNVLNHHNAFQSVVPLSEETSYSRVFYSRPIQIFPALPDSTMPFNVLCITCTLFTFIIGSMMNILVRKTVERLKSQYTGIEEEKTGLKKIIHDIRNRLHALTMKRTQKNEISSENGHSDKIDKE